MRTLNGAATTLLANIVAGERGVMVQLIQLDLSTTVRLTTAGRDVTWGGHTWLYRGGSIDQIEDTIGDFRSLTLTLPGVDQTQLALALTEDVEDCAVNIWDALVDPATGQVADAFLAFSGTLSMPNVADGPSASVSVTAEHAGIAAVRPKPRRYTNDEQQRLYPGDTCFDFDPATDRGPLAWPSASFFRV